MPEQIVQAPSASKREEHTLANRVVSSFPTLDEVEVSEKTVVVRVDLKVAVENAANADTFIALSGIGRPTAIPGAGKHRIQFGLQYRLKESAHPLAQTSFDRVEPIVEKSGGGLICRVRRNDLHGIVVHGMIYRPATRTPDDSRLTTPETTPSSIPTTSATAPTVVFVPTLNFFSRNPSQ